ncbi:MAG: hypothetical protein ABSH50_25480 [Bryobacteraceae bacterium]|jgi:aromatic ring-cleaving dioxygenase
MKILLICALAAVPLAAQQQRDYLTVDEGDQIREAQDPNDRLALYIHFAQQRLSQVDHWLTREKAGRSVFIHDALDDYSNIIDAIDNVTDDALQRHVDIKIGTKALIAAEQDMLARLRKIQEDQPKDISRYDFVLRESLDATSDSLDLATQDPAARAAAVAAKQAKEKKEHDAELTPTERAEKQTQADKDARQPQKKAPTLLRPGETVQGKEPDKDKDQDKPQN